MSNPPPGAHSGAVVPTRLAAVRADWTAAASADVTQRVSSQSLAAVAVELGEGQAKLSSPSSLNAIPRTVVVQQQPPRPHHVDTTDGSSTDSGVAAPTPSHSVVASASLVLPTTGQADADHSTAVPIASGAAAQPASRGDLPLNARRADHRVLTVSTGTTPVQPSTPHHAYMLSSPRSTQTEREEDPRITLRPWTLQYMMDGKPHAKLQSSFVRENAWRYKLLVRWSTLAFVIAQLVFIPYDYARFYAEGKMTKFNLTLALRFGLYAPVGLLIMGITCHRATYYKYSQHLALFAVLMGFGIIAFVTLGDDPGYGTLALFIAYLSTFTPLVTVLSAPITVFLNLVYAAALLIVHSGLSTVQYVETLGVLALFSVCVTWANYRREYYLRKNHLAEQLLLQRQERLEEEQERSATLLKSMLPPTIMNDLLNGRSVISSEFSCVTVLFCELVNFSAISESRLPEVVVTILNRVYSAFDQLIDEHHVHKVETVGEVYMVVAGAPSRCVNHAQLCANMALDMMAALPRLARELEPVLGGNALNLHIGLNSGPIVAGIVGLRNPRYKLFGDTVNTASRMESTCEAGKIQCSPSTAQLLRKHYVLQERTSVFVKGKGEMTTFYLQSRMRGTPKFAAPLGDTPPSRLGDLPQGTSEHLTVQSFEGRSWAPPRTPSDRLLALPGLAEDLEEGASRASEAADSKSDTPSPPRAARKHGIRQIRSLKRDGGLAESAFAASMRDLLVRQMGGRTHSNNALNFARPVSHRRNVTHDVLLNVSSSNLFDLQEGPVQSPATSAQREQALDSAVVLPPYLRSRTAMCFPSKNDDPLEQRFVASHAAEWLRFAVLSCVGLAVALVTLVGYDYVKFHDDRDRWVRVALIRYCGGLPLVLAYLALAKWRPQLMMRRFGPITTVALLLLGADAIAISIAGGDPGYGVLALFIVYTFNLAGVLFLHRLLVFAALIAAHVTLTKMLVEATTWRFFFAQLSYLLVFYVGQALPVWALEYYIRVHFFRLEVMREQMNSLLAEEQRSRKLLVNLLPESVVDELKHGRKVVADDFTNVTILFTDMVGFTAFSSKVTPSELVVFLNAMFSEFDRIALHYGLHKVEIIGDAYFAVAGCPQPHSQHALAVVHAALDMLEVLPTLREVAQADINIRVGVHSGPIKAAVVGMKDPRYHLFGGTVSLAMKMESHGVPGSVHLSSEAFEAVRDSGDFVFESRGEVDIRGVGARHTHLVASRVHNSLGAYVASDMTMASLPRFQSAGAGRATGAKAEDAAAVPVR